MVDVSDSGSRRLSTSETPSEVQLASLPVLIPTFLTSLKESSHVLSTWTSKALISSPV